MKSDKSKVESILINILKNSLKYQKGKNIYIVVEQIDNNIVKFDIIDNGHGFY